MPHDPEAFADMVVMTVKSALAPVLERLAASEQKNRDLESRVLELSGLRDRVTVVETKALMSLAPSVIESVPAFDPTPLMQRIDATDAQVKLLEARPVAVTDAELTGRVAAVESRLQKAELLAEIKAGESAPLLASLSDLTKDFGVIRERVAVVETRAQVPGPSGKDGADGKPGRDGVDGVGFDDMDVEFDGDRTITIKAQRGLNVKTWPLVLPYQRQKGVFVEGQTYVQGDVATFGGSQWHCETETIVKPGESKDWTLIVKRGRDGKDGKDAPQALPVVKR